MLPKSYARPANLLHSSAAAATPQASASINRHYELPETEECPRHRHRLLNGPRNSASTCGDTSGGGAGAEQQRFARPLDNGCGVKANPTTFAVGPAKPPRRVRIMVKSLILWSKRSTRRGG